MEKPLEIKINLLEQKPPLQVNAASIGVLLLLMVVVVFTLYSYSMQSRELSFQQQNNIALQEKLVHYEPAVSDWQPLVGMETTLATMTTEEATLILQRVSYVNTINEIHSLTPSEVSIMSMSIQLPRIIITGISPEHTGVSELLAGLKTNPQFNRVGLLTSEINQNSSQTHFTIEMEWEAGAK